MIKHDGGPTRLKGLLCENVIMNKLLEIFVKRFYVWSKIGVWTLSSAFFSKSDGMGFSF